MVSSVLLAQMRASTASFLTDTCTIEARSPARGESGEVAEVWTAYATAVACRIITVGNRFNDSAGTVSNLDREHIKDVYRVVVPAGTGLNVGQRITVSDGTRYEVTDLMTDRTDGTDEQAVIVRVR